jgi:PHD/YefM family antitoxin component YafN of YafNO toxin-antitoxin module
MLDLIRVEEVGNKVIIPKEDFEKIIADVDSLIETIEILSDKELIEQIKESERNIKAGKVKEIKSKKDIDALFH